MPTTFEPSARPHFASLAAMRTACGLVLAVCFVTACDKLGWKAPQRSETGGEVDNSFKPASIKSVKGVPIADVRAAVAKRLRQPRPKPIGEAQWKHAMKLYAEYGGYPIWLDGNGLRERRTKTLMTALLNADADALALDAYPLDDLHRLLATLLKAKRPSPELLGDLDVVLTATYVTLGQDLLTGQVDPSRVSQDWHIAPTSAQVDSALGRFLGDRRFDITLMQMRPEYPEYKDLQKQLTRFRQIVAKGGWDSVPLGKALKAGDTAPAERLTALRNRLRVEGYELGTPKGSAGSNGIATAVYDQALAAAVAQFQREHGIAVDSALGKETLQALNVPARFRLGQIAANMERYRWMPRSLGDKYVFVNVPSFRLDAYEDGKPVMNMKVIVGAEYKDKNTPVFSDSMQYVVFRPYWNATDSIAAKELWPKVEADPTFLDRNEYEIVNEGGKERIRQKPGVLVHQPRHLVAGARGQRGSGKEQGRERGCERITLCRPATCGESGAAAGSRPPPPPRSARTPTRPACGGRSPPPWPAAPAAEERLSERFACVAASAQFLRQFWAPGFPWAPDDFRPRRQRFPSESFLSAAPLAPITRSGELENARKKSPERGFSVFGTLIDLTDQRRSKTDRRCGSPARERFFSRCESATPIGSQSPEVSGPPPVPGSHPVSPARREVNYMLKLFVAIQSKLAEVRSEEGQTMAEYGVVLAVITLVIVGTLLALSGAINGALEEVTGVLGPGFRNNVRQ